MKSPIRLFGLLVAIAAAAIGAAVPAQADQGGDGTAGRAVFVQTNDLEGNAIAAYHRNGDGSLTYLTSYPTGGQGGRQSGAGSDPIASQGALVLVPEANRLVSVSGGSGTIQLFLLVGDRWG